ncbi:tautomerase family protein [Teredinibacter sp. KSP-S5-2]|uniref:tautomerase family protein n=1 Tax=Teredinibacter sp. KSP-S5-2 TaxID=3034506 RepID=UPI00293415F0|nr:tautomerase family protein [Teredinibacter sp. KSP-S5-2]WNO10279.1 tautomerase family protein [Teredinibacter sp. KSP-S5-2]
MIVVYGIDKKLNPIKAKLSDVIHQCMQEVLGLPEDKRAHRFVPLAAENFYYPGGRSDAYTVIEINMIEGREKETIKALIKMIFSECETQLALAEADVEITVKQQPDYCWGFRGITGDEAKLNYSINV